MQEVLIIVASLRRAQIIRLVHVEVDWECFQYLVTLHFTIIRHINFLLDKDLGSLQLWLQHGDLAVALLANLVHVIGVAWHRHSQRLHVDGLVQIEPFLQLVIQELVVL